MQFALLKFRKVASQRILYALQLVLDQVTKHPSSIMAISNEVINEMIRIEQYWRTLIIREQIENVFDYRNNLMYTP